MPGSCLAAAGGRARCCAGAAIGAAAGSVRSSTFSAGFAEDKRSELAAAARVAQHFGTEHHEIVLHRRDVLAQLPQLVASRDAPVSFRA